MIPKLLIAAATLAIFGLVNTQIVQKEDLRRNGRPIFLELAPVDPRSLMQGDYMALNFVLTGQIVSQLPTGSVPNQAILSLDPQGKATFARWPNSSPLSPNEVRFNFKMQNGRPWLGTNAFFFEEGTASRYEGARFGEFRLNAQGEAILVGLQKALN